MNCIEKTGQIKVGLTCERFRNILSLFSSVLKKKFLVFVVIAATEIHYLGIFVRSSYNLVTDRHTDRQWSLLRIHAHRSISGVQQNWHFHLLASLQDIDTALDMYRQKISAEFTMMCIRAVRFLASRHVGHRSTQRWTCSIWNYIKQSGFLILGWRVISEFAVKYDSFRSINLSGWII